MSHAQYMVSTEFLFKSLYQAEQIKNRVFEAKNLSMLGLSFSELKDFKNAQINLQKALKIYQILGDKIRYTRTLHYIGLALATEKTFSGLSLFSTRLSTKPKTTNSSHGYVLFEWYWVKSKRIR
jgi:hypothetical protein